MPDDTTNRSNDQGGGGGNDDDQNPGQPGQTGGDQDETNAHLRRARADAKDWRLKAQAAQRKLDELEGAGKTELEKAAQRASAAERAREEAEARALRLEVAHERGLPATLARRLQGGTREEIEADAEELARTLGNGVAGGPGRRPTSTNAGQHSTGSPPGMSPSEWLRGKLTQR